MSTTRTVSLNKKYARPDSGREGEGTTRLSNHAIMGDSTSPSTILSSLVHGWWFPVIPEEALYPCLTVDTHPMTAGPPCMCRHQPLSTGLNEDPTCTLICTPDSVPVIMSRLRMSWLRSCTHVLHSPPRSNDIVIVIPHIIIVATQSLMSISIFCLVMSVHPELVSSLLQIAGSAPSGGHPHMCCTCGGNRTWGTCNFPYSKACMCCQVRWSWASPFALASEPLPLGWTPPLWSLILTPGLGCPAEHTAS